jgi:Zn-dependent protease
MSPVCPGGSACASDVVQLFSQAACKERPYEEEILTLSRSDHCPNDYLSVKDIQHMIKPAFVQPNDEVDIVGRIFNTPLVTKGKSWFPLTQLIAWPIMAWVAKKRIPERSWVQCLGVGALTMPVLLGSEWGHNLAHAAAANRVGKPVDVIRIIWGMPLLVYYDINDEEVTPRQHVIRALGGPVFNILVLPIALYLRSRSAPKSMSRDIANVAAGANIFLPAVGLLPIPGIDGGPILKWSLVQKGQTPQEADRSVRKVDGVLGTLLTIAGVFSLRRRKWLIGGLLVQLGAIALSVALGILKEQE